MVMGVVAGGLVGGDVFAHLPGGLVWDLPAVLLWDAGAGGAGDLEGNLPGHLGALLPGHVGARRLHDVPDGVNALGLGHGGALGGLDQALGLDGLLGADAFDLAVASWSSVAGGDVGSDTDQSGGWSESEESWVGLGVGLWLGVSVALVEVAGCGDGGEWSNGVKSGSNWTGDGGTCIGADNSRMGGDGCSGDGWLSNVLDCTDMALVANKLSFLANLGLDVLALVNVGGLNDGVGLVDAGLMVGGGALLVRHLAGHRLALPLADGGAGGVVLGPVLGLGHRAALLLEGLSALGRVGRLVHSLADGMRPVLVGVRGCVRAMSVSVLPVSADASVVSVAGASVAVVALVVGLGLGLWLAQRQRRQNAQSD